MAKRTLSKKTIFSAVLALIVVVAVVLIWKSTHTAIDTNVNTGTQPTFQAVLPRGSSIEDLGGWQKLTPPNNDPYYVFMDTISEVVIKVSQQPLPQSFKDNVDSKIAEVAKGYSATDSFEVNGTKVYIGTNAKGPQSVIFTKNDLLILITSEGSIDTSAWKTYIKSLG